MLPSAKGTFFVHILIYLHVYEIHDLWLIPDPSELGSFLFFLDIYLSIDMASPFFYYLTVFF